MDANRFIYFLRFIEDININYIVGALHNYKKQEYQIPNKNRQEIFMSLFPIIRIIEQLPRATLTSKARPTSCIAITEQTVIYNTIYQVYQI